MKNIFLCLIFGLFIISCATRHDASLVLYQEYSRYKNNANKNNIIEVASKFFSPSLLGKNYRTDPDATSQLLFKNHMMAIDSHHEKINAQKGCLTINGYDEEKAPLIFSLKYVLRNNQWLIDKIHVVFIEKAKDFSNKAKCPSEYQN